MKEWWCFLCNKRICSSEEIQFVSFINIATPTIIYTHMPRCFLSLFSHFFIHWIYVLSSLLLLLREQVINRLTKLTFWIDRLLIVKVCHSLLWERRKFATDCAKTAAASERTNERTKEQSIIRSFFRTNQRNHLLLLIKYRLERLFFPAVRFIERILPTILRIRVPSRHEPIDRIPSFILLEVILVVNFCRKELTFFR